MKSIFTKPIIGSLVCMLSISIFFLNCAPLPGTSDVDNSNTAASVDSENIFFDRTSLLVSNGETSLTVTLNEKSVSSLNIKYRLVEKVDDVYIENTAYGNFSGMVNLSPNLKSWEIAIPNFSKNSLKANDNLLFLEIVNGSNGSLIKLISISFEETISDSQMFRFSADSLTAMNGKNFLKIELTAKPKRIYRLAYRLYERVSGNNTETTAIGVLSGSLSFDSLYAPGTINTFKSISVPTAMPFSFERNHAIYLEISDLDTNLIYKLVPVNIVKFCHGNYASNSASLTRLNFNYSQLGFSCSRDIYNSSNQLESRKHGDCAYDTSFEPSMRKFFMALPKLNEVGVIENTGQFTNDCSSLILDTGEQLYRQN